MLLSDTLHLVGFNIFDRKKMEEERKTEKKSTGIFKPELKQTKSVYDNKDDGNDTISKAANNPRFKPKLRVDTQKASIMKLPTSVSPYKASKED